MGNACCGAKEESSKPSAFQSGFSVDSSSVDQTASASAQQQSASASASAQHSSSHAHDSSSGHHPARAAAETTEVDKETSEEDARLEILVQTAGRAMVAVHSTRGNNPYYDQGFAAALAQHLEQTTQFPTQVPPLPKAPSLVQDSSSSVYTRLSQPAWEDLQLGSKGGLAGCAGENPEKYLNRVAESFLDQVVPKKEQLFTKVKPIVESLL